MEVARRLKDQVSQPPGPVVYPIEWKSIAQRITVMRKLRATGIPYQRRFHPLSEDLYHSWRIRDVSSDEVQVFTDVSYAPYVKTEAGIQPFHRNTGHTTVEDDIERIQVGNIVNTVITNYVATV